jgi:spore coat polysaccharide biosynthesis protein SpsF
LVTAIVQARMGSTRLPGKVLIEVAGKTLLEHVLDRLSLCKTVNQIVVATSTASDDRRIVDVVKNLGYDVYVGSEGDVLDRYYRAAKEVEADIVARITGDCPLIDPILVDHVVGFYLSNQHAYDYVHNGESYPDGIVETEVFSFKVLEGMWNEARSIVEREHVTAFIHHNPGRFRIKTLQQEENLGHLRFTVDEPEDLEVIMGIMKYAPQDQVLHLEEVLDILARHPEIAGHNVHIKRNAGYLDSLAFETDYSSED